MPGTAEQKRQERAKRQGLGDVRVEVWLSASTVKLLDELTDERMEPRSDVIAFAITDLAYPRQ